MRLEKNSLFKKAILVIFLLSIASCKTKDVNETFIEKYQNQVKNMKLERTQPNQPTGPLSEAPKLNFAPPFPEVRAPENSHALEPGNEQYYSNAPNPSKRPADMFDLSYQDTVTHPFRKSGFEFDLINIPPEDSYGVKTAMSEKEYLLVGNESLQKSVDQINATKSKDDIEISEILIKEQQQLKRRQKMIKMFGEDVLASEATKNKSVAAKPKAEVNKTSEDAKNKAMPMPDTISQDKPPATHAEMQSASTIPVANKDNKTPDNNSKDASGNIAAEVAKNKN